MLEHQSYRLSFALNRVFHGCRTVPNSFLLVIFKLPSTTGCHSEATNNDSNNGGIFLRNGRGPARYAQNLQQYRRPREIYVVAMGKLETHWKDKFHLEKVQHSWGGIRLRWIFASWSSSRKFVHHWACDFEVHWALGKTGPARTNMQWIWRVYNKRENGIRQGSIGSKISRARSIGIVQTFEIQNSVQWTDVRRAGIERNISIRRASNLRETS